MEFVLAVLASMMAPTLAGHQLARLAAQEAIDAYRPHGTHELVTIGQIVAFAVTALDTLRLSMPRDVSLSMKLRLRGNANGLNRSSRDCTRLLETARLPAKAPLTGMPPLRPHPNSTALAGSRLPDPVMVGESPAPQDVGAGPSPTKTMTGRRAICSDPVIVGRRLTGIDWADGMKSVAATLQAGANSASPGQRATDALWIEALNSVGRELTQATASPAVSPLSPSGTSPPTRRDIPVPPGPAVPPGSRHASPGNRPPARHRTARSG